MKSLSTGILLLTFCLGACKTIRPFEQPPHAEAVKRKVVQTAMNLQMLPVERTFMAINEREEPYSSRDMPWGRIWVYDLYLNVIAHPEPARLNSNDKNRKDDNGRPYPESIFEGATGRKRGIKGWVHYTENQVNFDTYYQLAQGRDGEYYIIVAETLAQPRTSRK